METPVFLCFDPHRYAFPRLGFQDIVESPEEPVLKRFIILIIFLLLWPIVCAAETINGKDVEWESGTSYTLTRSEERRVGKECRL